MGRHAVAALCALTIGLAVQTAPAMASVTVYGNDFTTAAGPEWSPSTAIMTTPSGEKALGPIGNDTESVTLTSLPSHSAITVSFDLYVLDSWDGNGPADGPDFWEADVTGGPTLQAITTFGHNGCSSGTQSFPDPYPASHPLNTGAAAVGTLGFGTGCFGDSTYHFSFSFPHTASSVQINAIGSNLQGWTDEGWALDNVAVTVEPLVGTLPVTSVDPNAGGQDGTRSIVIRGSGFKPGATPSFSGSGLGVLGTTFKSATKLAAQIEIAPNAPTGSRAVTVTNTDATTGTCPACFTVDPAPKPTSTLPAQVSPDTTLDVHVLGSDFRPGAAVKFVGGGVTVHSTTFLGSGDLKANVTVETNAVARRTAVKVVNPDGGRGTCTACFTVVEP